MCHMQLWTSHHLSHALHNPVSLISLPPLSLIGKYELVSILTHKGRSADSGHYVAWVKQDDGRWVLFDDSDLRSVWRELCGIHPDLT